jgi:hypothetical protein
LQEFVQCSPTFHIPANYPVLQWSFESQMADSATLEFRATVAFLLEGVPHHVAGGWQQKKKDAQRDAAERALSFYKGKSQWAAEAHNGSNSTENSLDACPSPYTGSRVSREETLVEEYCRTSEMSGNTQPGWSLRWDGAECTAILEIALSGVPHKLAGKGRSSEVAARQDVARRALWYLQYPGFQDCFEPDPLSEAIVSMKIPSAPQHWVQDHATEAALEVAERKTAIMRVQNRLQQTFSRQLRPGLSVWEWAYETDGNDEDWPPLYRASVSIPVMGKTFIGNWVRGQRDAQLDTIQQVTRALDESR